MAVGGCPLCVGCLYCFQSIFWPQILNILYFIFKENVCKQPALFVVRGPIQNIVGFPLKKTLEHDVLPQLRPILDAAPPSKGRC